ncbi:hypothetical protein [Nocardia asiatica]|uniref:hypothetical protein n=1 Tax=Nocardia asiatica TaxID=209252 RepID=UPI003EE12B93
MCPMTGHKHYVGGGGAGENSPPAVAGEHPRNPYYADLVAEAHRQWAVAVAENLVWLAGRPHSLHTVDECWIDTGTAMCLRYSNTVGRFAARFAHLEVSPITGPLSPTLREHDSGSAVQQASNLFTVRLGGGPPERWEWTDPDGRRWWGDSPADGWPSVLLPRNRLVTIPVSPPEQARS